MSSVKPWRTKVLVPDISSTRVNCGMVFCEIGPSIVTRRRISTMLGGLGVRVGGRCASRESWKGTSTSSVIRMAKRETGERRTEHLTPTLSAADGDACRLGWVVWLRFRSLNGRWIVEQDASTGAAGDQLLSRRELIIGLRPHHHVASLADLVAHAGDG